MGTLVLAWVSALWLGMLTSIGPCPLATNIAAISFIGRRIDRPRLVFLTGLLYTLGRMLTYIVLGVVIITSVVSTPQLSHFLQKYMNKALGPILIVVGVILLGLIRIKLPGSSVSVRTQTRAESWGVWGAGFLGIVFALSLCPITAALFFGSLIPLSVKHSSTVALPALYGLGTGLPVMVFAALIAFGVERVAAAFDRLTQIERWVRRITGAVIVVIGIYLCLVHIFHVIE